MNDNTEELKQLREEYDTDYEAGQDNITPMGLDLHNVVFSVSAVLIIVFVLWSLIAPETANGALMGVRDFFESNFNWAFLSAGNIFVLFCLALIVMPVGKIRLGGEEAKPDFSRLSWFSMLFAAGMGIGLMFWAVAEPVGYFVDGDGAWAPFNTPGLTDEARRAAMGATMYHWGLHPWAIYGVVALALAFFTYNKGLPLTVRSTFYPLLGDRVWGRTGDIIDILAVLATLFGLATSLGFGAQQAAAGIGFLSGDAIEGGLALQVAIIVGVTFVALVSVMRGIDGGVKILSNVNVAMAGVLMIFVILVGGLAVFFSSLLTTTTSYAEYMLPLSNPVGREDQNFYNGWTVFYWAWWISWSPFVGMFIARVSKGRTVREFLTAVLIVPTVVTIVWMSALGGNGIEQAEEGIEIMSGGVDLALFNMLENLPLANIAAFLAICLVLVFFVTSSDSGSLVIDSITAGGKLDAPQAQRVFWVVVEGLIAAVLLFGGGDQGLEALQAASIATGLPFAIILLLMCVSLVKGLTHERKLLALETK